MCNFVPLWKFHLFPRASKTGQYANFCCRGAASHFQALRREDAPSDSPMCELTAKTACGVRKLHLQSKPNGRIHALHPDINHSTYISTAPLAREQGDNLSIINYPIKTQDKIGRCRAPRDIDQVSSIKIIILIPLETKLQRPWFPAVTDDAAETAVGSERAK